MKNNTVTRLLAYVGKSKKTLLFVFVTVLVGNVSLLLAPRYIGDAVDLLAEGGDGWERAFVTLLALIAGLYAVGSFLQWLSARAGKLVAFRTTNAIVRDAFAKLGRLPLSFFDTHKHGDVIHTLTNDADMVAEGLSQGIIQFISGVLSIVISLVMMLMLDVRVTLVAVFVTPLCFFVGWAITRYGSRRFRAQAGTLGELNGFAEEYISSFHTVKLFSYEPNAVEAFGRINAELYQSGYRAQFASALVNPTTRFVNNIAYVLVGVFSLLSVLDGNLTAGGITAFLTYTSQFSKPFNEITAITTQIQNAAASARRIFGLLDEREQQPEPFGRGRAARRAGQRRVPRRQLFVQQREAAYPPFQLYRRAGYDRRHRRPYRRGQDDARQSADALLRAGRRRDRGRRQGHHHADARQPAPLVRDGAAGNMAV